MMVSWSLFPLIHVTPGMYPQDFVSQKEKAHFSFATKLIFKCTPDQDHCLVHGTPSYNFTLQLDLFVRILERTQLPYIQAFMALTHSCERDTVNPTRLSLH